MRLSKRVATLEDQIQSDGRTYVYGDGYIPKGLLARVAELEEEVTGLRRAKPHSHTEYAPLETFRLADQASRNSVSALNRLAELERQFRDHHDAVLVNDASSPGGTRILERYYLYRGTTPQGQVIHPVRRSAERTTEYHVEGKAVRDE